MALSKTYTLSKIRSLIRDLADEISPNKLQDSTILEIINKNTLDIAEQLNGASAPDYGTTTTISDAASSVAAGYDNTPLGSYANSTRTITNTGHGLTAADIGKRIMYGHLPDTPGSWCISEIESITNANSFVVKHAIGTDIAGGELYYAVFSRHSTSNVDISSLRVDKIIKIKDSNNGLVAEKKDLAFENLANIDMYDNSVFYNLFGETLFLFKGGSVNAWGTLTLYYYRLPVLLSADGDYVDLRDKYVPLLIDKCYLEVYSRGKQQPPQSILNNVQNATQQIRGANADKEATILSRKEG